MLINKPVTVYTLSETFGVLQATAGAASHLLLTLIKDTARRTYVPVAAISLVIMWVRICTLHDWSFTALLSLPVLDATDTSKDLCLRTFSLA